MDKEVGSVYILEAAIEDGRPFRVFYFKEPNYVIKILLSWTNLDDM